MRAVGGRRLGEARFTGGFPYASWKKGSPPAFDREALARINGEVGRKLSRHPTPDILADAGLLKLIAGQPDDAIELFEQSVATGPADAARLSDLGAAYLVRFSQPEKARPDDLVAALSATERALAVKPAEPEALFNQSLALERLSLRREAQKAWREAFRTEPGTGWARETRSHLEKLAKPSPVEKWQSSERSALLSAAFKDDQTRVATLVARRPHAARLLGEQELLGLWAEAAAHGQEGVAARLLSAARRIGTALAAFRGDRLLQDAVAAIDVTSQGSARRAILVDGHRDFRHALAAERRDEFDKAAHGFARAGNLLTKAVTPFSRVAIAHQGVAAYYCTRHDEALRLYAVAVAGADPERYPTLVGYSFWMKGVVEFVTSALPEALVSHLAALRLYEKAGESAHEGFVHSMIAADLVSLGEHEQAWNHRLQALARLSELDDLRRIYSVLWATSEASLADGQPQLALHLLDELLETVPSDALPGVIAESLGRRGVVESTLRSTRASLRDLELAKTFLPRIPDGLRDRVQADLLVAEAQIRRAHEPHVAINLMTYALNFYKGADYRVDSAVFHQERAAAYRLTGNLSQAESDLESAIKDYELGNNKITDEVTRRLYARQVRGVFDEIIELQIDRHLPSRALEFANRANRIALGLGDMPLRHDSLDLPDNAVFIEYSVLENRVIVWVGRGDLVQFFVLQLGAKELERRVSRFREDIAQQRAPHEGSRLYADLLQPIEKILAGATSITFIPDKSLYGLPFSALYDSRKSHFLIQDYVISIAPVAEGLSFVAMRPWRTDGRPSALVIAGDDFNANAFPGLSPLAGARKEAKAIARLYTRNRLLLGPESTKSTVLRLIPRYEIIHLAAHGLVFDRSPSGSVFLLAPSNGPERKTNLSIKNFDRLNLERTRLVVLASCSTAVGGPASHDGLFSLASPFLRKGVPVIASLWDIPDEISVRLFVALHQYIEEGVSPSLALQKAQLRLLESSSPPHLMTIKNWAGIEVLDI